MKSKYLFAIAALATIIGFSSCDLDGDSNYTPEIIFTHPLTQNNDTLNFYYTDDGGTVLMDTISVQDTVLFNFIYTGYANNLKSLIITQTGDSVTKILYPDSTKLDSIFLSTSDYANGKFYMPGSFTTLTLPFRYIALKKTTEAKLKFQLVSDAVFDTGFASNTASITIKTPIK